MTNFETESRALGAAWRALRGEGAMLIGTPVWYWGEGEVRERIERLAVEAAELLRRSESAWGSEWRAELERQGGDLPQWIESLIGAEAERRRAALRDAARKLADRLRRTRLVHPSLRLSALAESMRGEAIEALDAIGVSAGWPAELAVVRTCLDELQQRLATPIESWRVSVGSTLGSGFDELTAILPTMSIEPSSDSAPSTESTERSEPAEPSLGAVEEPSEASSRTLLVDRSEAMVERSNASADQHDSTIGGERSFREPSETESADQNASELMNETASEAPERSESRKEGPREHASTTPSVVDEIAPAEPMVDRTEEVLSPNESPIEEAIETSDGLEITGDEPVDEAGVDEPVDERAAEATASPTIAASTTESTTTPAESSGSPSTESQGASIDAPSAVWKLLAEGRWSLAYHLTASRFFPGDASAPSAPLLRFLILSETLRSADDSIVQDLQQAILELSDLPEAETTTSGSLAVRLTAQVAALRTTMITPAIDSVVLLDLPCPLERICPSLDRLRDAVRTYGQLRLTVDTSVLVGLLDRDAWNEALADSKRDLARRLTAERRSKVIYSPATDVWHSWLAPTGFIGRLVERIAEDRLSDSSEAEAWLRESEREKETDRRIRETDHQLRGRDSDRFMIEARARRALRKKVEEFGAGIRRWLRLRESEPGRLGSHRQLAVDQVRLAAMRDLEPARSELAALRADRSTAAELACAATVCLRMLDRFANLFRQERTDLSDESETRDQNEARSELESSPMIDLPSALDVDLPTVSGLDLSERSTIDSAEAYRCLLVAASRPVDLRKAFAERIEEGDLHSAALLAERADREESGNEGARQRSRRLQEARETWSQRIEGEREELRERLEKAVISLVVSDADRNELQAMLEAIPRSFVETKHFAPLRRSLERVRDRLAELQALAESKARRMLDETHFPPEREDDRERIERLLQSGELGTVDEYLHLVREGEPLPSTRDGEEDLIRRFDDYFPGFTSEFHRWAESDRGSVGTRFIGRVEQGHVIGPLNCAELPGPYRQSAGVMLRAWHKLKTDGGGTLRTGETEETLRQFFGSLGFGSPRVALQDPIAGQVAARLTVDAWADPSLCIVPAYGSQANGVYSVLAVQHRPTASDIIRIVRMMSQQHPILVLFLGRIGDRERRSIAEQGRRERVSFLLIDETLVARLAAERRTRLGAMFDFTLPFAFLAGLYSTNASTVPAELFFGRDQEYETVLDRDGTNLVYGGRQLGKSALLREVARRNHDPARGMIVLWIDLKNRGIGTTQPAKDLWTLIGQELHRAEVLRSHMSNQDTIINHVRGWLDGDPGRRILLLLDEADAFLEQDGRPVDSSKNAFPVLSSLKGLMFDTDRRFKVVFAGLHNVQRAARDANTPIAHLGTPVNIGPLLDNGQWRHAKRLVERPLTALGFRFRTPDLSMRILSHTNYYPSLIQIFCRHLLTYLMGDRSKRHDWRVSPPYVITSADIDRIYRDPDFQHEVRDRFELTLNLDERYRLIALRIALECGESGSREWGDIVRGFDVNWVRSECLLLWRAGFEADSSYDQFRIILDEMVGLGVLRRIGSERYTLRSANVLRLLGSVGEIEGKLFDVIGGSGPPVYESSTFRRALDPQGAWKPSPLTAEQEGVLLARSNGVVVLAASVPAGLDDLPIALGALERPEVRIETGKGLTSSAAFDEWIAMIDASKPDGLTLAICEPGWEVAWVRGAADRLARKTTSRRSFLRVVFIADPCDYWRWVETPVDDPIIRELAVRPWIDRSVRQWLFDNAFSADALQPSGVAEIMERTGGWRLMLERFAEIYRSDQTLQWRAALARIALDSDLPFAAVPLNLPEPARRAFALLAQFGPLDGNDLVGEDPSLDGTLETLTRWGDRLGFLSIDDERLRLDRSIERWSSEVGTP